MRVGSLFSGIGGFDLGLERAGGFTTAWFCEQDEFCQHVLAEHWPGVPCYPDITELRGADVEPVDVLCGGFPCQDLSYAGAGAGLAGARSGLWSEYARLIGELGPRYVVVENVSALLARGLGTVLGDLAALGYDAEWDCIPASAVGAPHQRDRVWLVAYPQGSSGPVEQGEPAAGGTLVGSVVGPGGRDQHGDSPEGVRLVGSSERRGASRGPQAQPRGRQVADPEVAGLEGAGLPGRSAVGSRALADPDQEQRDRGAGQLGQGRRDEPADCCGRELQDPDCCAVQPWRVGGRAAQAGGAEWWAVEPPVGRVAHGVSNRLDQLAALGNALVPEIATWIGSRLMAYEASASSPTGRRDA